MELGKVLFGFGRISRVYERNLDDKDLNPGPAISPAFRLLGLAGRTISLSKLLSLLKEACAPTSDVTEVDTRMSKTNMVTVKKDTLCSKAKITFTDAKRVAPFYVAFVRFLKINM